MYKIRTLNNISAKGLSRFPGEGYRLGDMEDPDAILVRKPQTDAGRCGPVPRCCGSGRGRREQHSRCGLHGQKA